jgi:hypothetical protein
MGPDPYLEWKVRIFLLGALLGLIGVARESSLLVGGAILVLLVGVLLRLLRGAPGAEWGQIPEEEEDDGQSRPGEEGLEDSVLQGPKADSEDSGL